MHDLVVYCDEFYNDDMRYHTTVQVGEFNMVKYPYVSIMEVFESPDDYPVQTHLMQSLE